MSSALLVNYDWKLDEEFKASLVSDTYLFNWIPAVVMLILAEVSNKWKGNQHFYMPCLLMCGLTICYKTFKMQKYYTEPSKFEVYAYEEYLRT